MTKEMFNNTTIAFRLENTDYTTVKEGYYYAQPVNGKKNRISKQAFMNAYTAYVNAQVSDEQWQAAADAEKEQQDIARQARDEADEQAVLGNATEGISEATEEHEEPKTDEQPSKAKTAKEAWKKAKRKPRRSKDVALSVEFKDGSKLTLTSKQVDFMRRFTDSTYWEHGLDSAIWCDIFCDEVGGQFADKPMTVGAMISTLREKNVIVVSVDKINGKKAKYFALTKLGKLIAKELGLN